MTADDLAAHSGLSTRQQTGYMTSWLFGRPGAWVDIQTTDMLTDCNVQAKLIRKKTQHVQ